MWTYYGKERMGEWFKEVESYFRRYDFAKVKMMDDSWRILYRDGIL